mmetsp:Transcript_59280/g.162643  ORF Transcript_59280/g.162643 Transcript_59280/m.162643 type:complete len:244 (-) Transcript_59280:943-1674(-)
MHTLPRRRAAGAARACVLGPEVGRVYLPAQLVDRLLPGAARQADDRGRQGRRGDRGAPDLLRVGVARDPLVRGQGLRRGGVDRGPDPGRHAVDAARRVRSVEAAAQQLGQGGNRQVLFGPRVQGGVVHRLQRQGDGQARVQQARPVVPAAVQHLGAGRGQLLPGQRAHVTRRRHARAGGADGRLAGGRVAAGRRARVYGAPPHPGRRLARRAGASQRDHVRLQRHWRGAGADGRARPRGRRRL